MRRIAAELDAGTMTLYHYVRTKDELLSLVDRRGDGRGRAPGRRAVPRRLARRDDVIAERTACALVRHPWILDITDDPPVGPNSVRHFDQSLRAVASLPISLARRSSTSSSAVDEYVFGFCLHERNNQQHDGDPFDEQMVGYVNELIATGEYPNSRRSPNHGLEETWAEMARYFGDPDRFERGLERLLDGFDAALGLTN